jgi:hypothetical protein
MASGHVVECQATLALWASEAGARILEYAEWHGHDAESHGGNQKGVGDEVRHVDGVCQG